MFRILSAARPMFWNAFWSAAHAYEARIVVRCQASHPLLDPKMLWASARYADDSGMDLVTVARLPEGVACEAVPVRTLERIAA